MISLGIGDRTFLVLTWCGTLLLASLSVADCRAVQGRVEQLVSHGQDWRDRGENPRERGRSGREMS